MAVLMYTGANLSIFPKMAPHYHIDPTSLIKQGTVKYKLPTTYAKKHFLFTTMIMQYKVSNGVPGTCRGIYAF